MTLQQLNFFANLDYETMRQSLIAGLKIDPEDADALRRRIEGLTKSADEGEEPMPEALSELLGLLKLGVTKFAGIEADADSADAAADNDDVTLAECFRDMREDWRQLRIQRIENAEERSRTQVRPQRRDFRGNLGSYCCICRLSRPRCFIGRWLTVLLRLNSNLILADKRSIRIAVRHSDTPI